MGNNEVKLIGNVGAEPKMYQKDGKQAVCTFSVATNERYKKQDGEQVEHTEWHSIVAFGPSAEYCNNLLKKGSHVLLEGALRTDEYVTEQQEKRKRTQIVLKKIYRLNDKSINNYGGGDSKEPPRTTEAEHSTMFDMDLDEFEF